MPEFRKGYFPQGGQYAGRGVSLAGIYTKLKLNILIKRIVSIRPTTS